MRRIADGDRIGKVLHNESESMCVELPLDSEDEDL